MAHHKNRRNEKKRHTKRIVSSCKGENFTLGFGLQAQMPDETSNQKAEQEGEEKDHQRLPRLEAIASLRSSSGGGSRASAPLFLQS
jgi:hypothetical protein